MITKNEYILNAFKENFEKCKEKRIALYGKGLEVKLIIDYFIDYNIVGIIDGTLETGYLYDNQVLSAEDIIQQEIELVVALIPPSEIEGVAYYLQRLCNDNFIRLYSIDGDNLILKYPLNESTALNFKRTFDRVKNKKIVLYGTGPRTQRIIEQCKDFNIVGIMDRSRTEGDAYGKKILNHETLIEFGAEIVIAITRSENTKCVYNRICGLCSYHHIIFYDLEGNNLFSMYGEAEGEKTPHFPIASEQLKKEIEIHDNISFDIFDTLLMRKTLVPSDVYFILEKRAKEDKIFVSDFVQQRKNAEVLAYTPYSTIYDIYASFQMLTSISDAERDRLIKLELEIEQSVLICREQMIEYFEYAIRMNKTVCLISDMYIPKSILTDILTKKEIIGYDKLFVSCDYGEQKAGRLFGIYKQFVGNGTCLHIGDSQMADVDGAQPYGIDTFKVKKSIDILSNSTYASIRDCLQTVNERSMVGMMISKVFNNPFALYHSDGRAEIIKAFDFAYLFIAPLITQYVLWLIDCVTDKEYNKILFAARDGYLVQKLYNYYVNKMQQGNLPDGVYFETSRMVAANAAATSDDIISWIFSLPYVGTPEEMLKQKFYLPDEEIVPYEESRFSSIVEYALAHKESIYPKAKLLQKRYLKYMTNVGLKSGEKYALVDCVTCGTCQWLLSKFAPFEIEGAYVCFYDKGDTIRRKLPSQSMQFEYIVDDNNFMQGKATSYLYNNYAFLENIFTAFHGSLIDFDENGNPMHDIDRRSQSELTFIEQSHAAIEAYFKDYIDNLYVSSCMIQNDVTDRIYSFKDLKYSNEHCNEMDEITLFDDLGHGILPLQRKL